MAPRISEQLRRAAAAGGVTIPRRHPAEVTAERLLTHYEKWHDRFSGYELDAISKVRFALQRIAEEDEGRAGKR